MIQTILIFLTGLNAGLFLAWSVSVTNGIGRLDDRTFLISFQSMNRAILNPAFYLVFFGAIFLHLYNLIDQLFLSESMILLSMLSSAIFLVGIFLVTVFGNIPLNEKLDKLNLIIMPEDECKQFRESFERPWNALNWVRTTFSSAAFLLLFIG